MNHQDNAITVVAIIAELVCAYFFVLGIGWMVAGDFATGILLLIGYWIFVAMVAVVVVLSLNCLAPIAIGLHLAVPIVSAVYLYRFVSTNSP